MRFVLASQSPARLDLLRRAGCDPEVIVSGVDETEPVGLTPAESALRLAELKGTAVLPRIRGEAVLVACDSILEFEGRSHGKPGSRAVARERWLRMRGNTGVLHTGHFVWVRDHAGARRTSAIVSTEVTFAQIRDDEVDTYVGTDEPTGVAGGFTIDGFGAAFVDGIVGDHTNVLGLSVPALRRMLHHLGIEWTRLWSLPDAG